MTKQELLKLHEAATRGRQRHERRTLVWAGVALAVLGPAVVLFGRYLVDHAEALPRLLNSGWRWILGGVGATVLLFAFLLSKAKPSSGGVPCPQCGAHLFEFGVKLAITSGNCCRCGRPIIGEVLPAN
jgi:hypothetical protein